MTTKEYNKIKYGDFIYYPYPYDREIKYAMYFVLQKKQHHCILLYMEDNEVFVITRKEVEDNYMSELKEVAIIKKND